MFHRFEGPTAFTSNRANLAGAIFNRVEIYEKYDEGEDYQIPVITYPDNTVFEGNIANVSSELRFSRKATFSPSPVPLPFLMRGQYKQHYRTSAYNACMRHGLPAVFPPDQPRKSQRNVELAFGQRYSSNRSVVLIFCHLSSHDLKRYMSCLAGGLCATPCISRELAMHAGNRTCSTVVRTPWKLTGASCPNLPSSCHPVCRPLLLFALLLSPVLRGHCLCV